MFKSKLHTDGTWRVVDENGVPIRFGMTYEQAEYEAQQLNLEHADDWQVDWSFRAVFIALGCVIVWVLAR